MVLQISYLLILYKIKAHQIEGSDGNQRWLYTDLRHKGKLPA